MMFDNLTPDTKVLISNRYMYIEGIILEGEHKGKYYAKDKEGNIRELKSVSKELLEIYNKNYKANDD